MTEQRIHREPSSESLAERVDIVDTLSSEDTFSVQILVYIRDGARVNIESRLPGVERARRLREANSFTCSYRCAAAGCRSRRPPSSFRDPRPLGRSGCAIAPTSLRPASARQLRVGIERDHVTKAGEHAEIPDLHRETIEASSHQVIQIEKLAPLSFPTHPTALGWVVDTMPVKKVKRGSTSGSRISPIEVIDQPDADVNQRVSFVLRLVGIRRVGYKRKVEVWIAIREITNLQVEGELLYLLLF